LDRLARSYPIGEGKRRGQIAAEPLAIRAECIPSRHAATAVWSEATLLVKESSEAGHAPSGEHQEQ